MDLDRPDVECAEQCPRHQRFARRRANFGHVPVDKRVERRRSVLLAKDRHEKRVKREQCPAMRLDGGGKLLDIGKDRAKVGDRRPSGISDNRNDLLDMPLEPLPGISRAPERGPHPYFRRQRDHDHPRLLARVVIGFLHNLPAGSDERANDMVGKTNEALKDEDRAAFNLGHIASALRELDRVGERP